MPPKKAAAAEKKTLLGRPGNNLKIGIVGWFAWMGDLSSTYCGRIGVPNVGKSSFFNALSNTSRRRVSICADIVGINQQYRSGLGSKLSLCDD